MKIEEISHQHLSASDEISPCFLHMYNAIFGRLEEYLDSKDIWKVTNNANKSSNDEYHVEHCFNVSCNHKCIY